MVQPDNVHSPLADESATDPVGRGCWKDVYTQVIIMGFIFFGVCGAFNSIIGLKTNIDPQYTKLGFGILYFLFSAGSFVAPALVNRFGPRSMMCVGSMVYAIFSLSLLLGGPMEILPGYVVTICAAFVGLGAALLWSGNAAMLLTYGTADTTASYVSTFWVIFNLGAVIGGIQTWVTNMNGGSAGTASSPTFMVYIAMNVLGCIMVWLLLPLDDVIRADGTRCEKPKASSSAVEEIRGMIKMMCYGPVLALLPLFLYSNWFYSFQLGVFCTCVFDASAGGLANALYWGAQMIGAKNLGCLLDAKRLSAGRRAWASVIASAVLIAVGWAWGLKATLRYGVDGNCDDLTPLAWNDSQNIEAMALMFVWGYCDALVQTWCYWVMTQLFSSSEDFARIAGIFKFAQSLGSAASFIISFGNPSNLVQLYINIGLFLVSLPGAFYLCHHVSNSGQTVALMSG